MYPNKLNFLKNEYLALLASMVTDKSPNKEKLGRVT